MISSNNSIGEHKKHDTALRHKIRNLRAKVRLLLPLDLCCKEQRRSNNLIKMSLKREQYMQEQEHRWNYAKQNVSDLFIPCKGVHMEKHLFEKLTNEEIEQIKEDKLYYVGKEFIEQFNEFLQLREKEKQKHIPKLNSYYPFQHHHKHPKISHKPSRSSGDDFDFTDHNNQMENRLKNEVRMESIQAKRKFINDEDFTKRTYIKIRGKEKRERHLQNYEKLLSQKQQSIRERNQMKMMKTAQSFQRKKNCEEMGSIYEFSEKLRNICLLRQSKSANLISRQ